MVTVTFNDRLYEVVEPVADSYELAEKGDRLMFRHDNPAYIFIAPKNEINSGWVIGIMLQ